MMTEPKYKNVNVEEWNQQELVPFGGVKQEDLIPLEGDEPLLDSRFLSVLNSNSEGMASVGLFIPDNSPQCSVLFFRRKLRNGKWAQAQVNMGEDTKNAVMALLETAETQRETI